MGVRFYKRLGGAAGFNISKSGISASVRTGMGSFGTKGYSIRTGIPGLSFRGSWGSGSSRSKSGYSFLDRLTIWILKFPFRLAWFGILCVAWVVMMFIALLNKALAGFAPKPLTLTRPRRKPPPMPLAPPATRPTPTGFAYVARDWSGNRVSGTIDVKDKGQALNQLERMRLVPISLEPTDK